jgi:serine/threonine-protein kinase
MLFINASPWADVSIDGRSIGVTPLGDVSVAVGSHEVMWRHPQLGERRKTVVVGAQTPVRLTVDMTSR